MGTFDLRYCMPVLGEHPIYDFRLQAWSDLQEALGDFMAAKKELLDDGVSLTEKMYGAAEHIHARVEKENTNIYIAAADRACITFLDTGALGLFLNDSTDNEMLEVLMVQIHFVAAAIGALPDATPYSGEECEAIFSGEGRIYDDALFLFTLHSFLSKGDGVMARKLLDALPVRREGDETIQTYFWDDALLFTLMIHVVWRSFALVSLRDQQRILQNYFFVASALNVPLRMCFEDAFRAIRGREDVNSTVSAWLQALLGSYEMIPVQGSGNKLQSFAVVVKDYLNKVSRENVTTIIQEQFISSFYKQNPNAGMYRGWLRDVLSIIIRIKNKDILP